MKQRRMEIAQHMHSYAQGQIALGDAKAAGVLAWDAAIAATAAGSGLVTSDPGIYVVLLLAGVLFLLISVIFVGVALIPDLSENSTKNPFSLICMAHCTDDELAQEVATRSDQELVRRLCEHAKKLSEVAMAKYRDVGKAIVMSTTASILLILALLIRHL